MNQYNGGQSDDSFVDDELVIKPVTEVGERFPYEFTLDRVTNRRKTFSGRETSMEDFEASTMDYYTPDSTMSKSSAYFLDKMKVALGECASSETTYQTALDSTLNNISSMRVNQTRRSSLPKLSDISSFHNRETMPINLENLQKPYANNAGKHAEEYISDSELDNDFLRYQGTQIKYEDITIDDIDDDHVQDEENDFDLGKYRENIAQNQENSLETQSIDDELSIYSIASSKSKTIDNSEDNYGDNSEGASSCVYLSKYQGKYTDDQESYQGSQSIDNKSSVYSVSSESKTTDGFNNTENSDYEYEDNSEGGSFKQPEMKPTGIPRKKFFVTPPKNNILRQKNDSETKLPPRRFFLTPKNQPLRKKSPSTADKFKYVQSPVGIYIKNSKTAAISRNVQLSNLPNVLPSSFFVDIPDIEHRWEFEIPEVVYRPSGIQHNLRPKEIHLPENIHCLMPMVSNMVVTKHETRIPGRELNMSHIRRKLHDNGDLTMCNTDLEDSRQDISILQVKPYI